MPWKGVTVSEQREGFTEDYQLTIAPSHMSITEALPSA